MWRPKTVRNYKAIAKSVRQARPEPDCASKVGCGRTIDWKNQTILPLSEVEALFSTQDLEQVLSSFCSNADFIAKKNKKEENIVVFSKLGPNGKVVDL
jgi:hypothetical protein